MSNEWLPLVVRVYRSSQQHVLEAMKLFKDRIQKSEFLDTINDMNMELLDSVLLADLFIVDTQIATQQEASSFHKNIALADRHSS